MNLNEIVQLIQRKAQNYYFHGDNFIEDIMKETGLNRAEVVNIINELVR